MNDKQARGAIQGHACEPKSPSHFVTLKVSFMQGENSIEEKLNFLSENTAWIIQTEGKLKVKKEKSGGDVIYSHRKF